MSSRLSVPRVEPLPESFVVPPDVVAASPMRGRLLVLAIPDDRDAARVRAELRSRAGVRVLARPSGLFGDALARSWLAFQPTSDVGLGNMLTAREFLTALRGLADDILDQPDGTTLVDWAPDYADPTALSLLASLYPDAVVLVRPEVAAGLTADLRQYVTILAPGTIPPQFAQPPAVVRRPAAATSPLQDRLIVVVGSGRSGTTWLEQLFLAHPRIGGVPRSETWLFEQLHLLWVNLRGNGGIEQLVDDNGLVRALRRYCDTVFVATLDRYRVGADFVVEKTPMHSYRLPEIAAVYPDAWVVHLLRDGRDVARSMSQVPFFHVPDLADAAAMWQRVVNAVQRDAEVVPRFREVRYEQLFADPVGSMQTLLGWAGLLVDGDCVAQLRHAAGERVSTHAGTDRTVGAGSWRSLSPTELAAIYRSVGKTLVRAGHVTPSAVWRSRLRALLRRS